MRDWKIGIYRVFCMIVHICNDKINDCKCKDQSIQQHTCILDHFVELHDLLLALLAELVDQILLQKRQILTLLHVWSRFSGISEV